MATTLRTIKKRSKQALPILLTHYPDAANAAGEMFLAERGENHHEFVVRCTHGVGDPCRVKGRPRCECTYHPLPGTPMFGGMFGYYEPEWDEKTALTVLQDAVLYHDRPAAMTDREWRRTLAISRRQPLTEADIRAMWGEDDEGYDPSLSAGGKDR